MAFIQEPAYLVGILFFLVLFSEWLSTKKFFKHIGSVLIIIITAAILANLNIIPTSRNAPAVYDKIFEYAAPLGIFFLLLNVRLKDLKFAGLPMLTMFTIGAIATVIATLAGYFIVSPQNHMDNAPAIAGMFTGTYTGGSANLNAVALHYSLQKDGNTYAAVNAVDNILTAFWIFMTILLPPILQKIFPRAKKIASHPEGHTEEEIRNLVISIKEEMTIADVSLLLALGFGSMFISSLASNYVPAIPSILVLTTLAIILAQFQFVQKLKGSSLIGMVLVLLFLAVIGAYCDIGALLQSGEVAGSLLLWDVILILIHGILIFGIGGLLKQDWDIISVASNACIGGSTTAPVCAASLDRQDLQVSGIIAGSIGLASGSYLGIMVAEFLK
ncbi:MAG TPA: DUF819 family protein [Chitinophagaceae bacterium]|mgnify:CR=1 FL=1|nr:DUF819 family protein [Chitinophagales bacterium]HRX93863.1 DUF819 family protein [Chitinophagaceae bacterium]